MRGRAVSDRAACSRAALGRAACSRAALGRAACSRAAFGRAACGRAPGRGGRTTGATRLGLSVLRHTVR